MQSFDQGSAYGSISVFTFIGVKRSIDRIGEGGTGIEALAEASKTSIGGASDDLPTLSGLSCQLATYSISLYIAVVICTVAIR